jgi:hypothetical protein
MSARMSLLIGATLLGLAAADLALVQSGGTLFLLRKLAGLVDYLVFWR